MKAFNQLRIVSIPNSSSVLMLWGLVTLLVDRDLNHALMIQGLFDPGPMRDQERCFSEPSVI